METVFITDIQEPNWKVHLDLANLKIMEGGKRDNTALRGSAWKWRTWISLGKANILANWVQKLGMLQKDFVGRHQIFANISAVCLQVVTYEGKHLEHIMCLVHDSDWLMETNIISDWFLCKVLYVIRSYKCTQDTKKPSIHTELLAVWLYWVKKLYLKYTDLKLKLQPHGLKIGFLYRH